MWLGELGEGWTPVSSVLWAAGGGGGVPPPPPDCAARVAESRVGAWTEAIPGSEGSTGFPSPRAGEGPLVSLLCHFRPG